jgi:CMP-N,N'-diacetyllegionaminic acid synthase
VKIIGLIPARFGSKRLPGKNMALLDGKPLLYWAIRGAINSGCFERIVVTTDWDICADVARAMCVDAIMPEPPIHSDTCHDFMWVRDAIDRFPGFDVFCILRPTSPFRTGDTIRRAMEDFLSGPRCDSMRGVSITPAHPRKSWVVAGKFMFPFDDGTIMNIPFYDLPTQALGDVYVQNGCIHIAWTATLEGGDVSGMVIRPFFTEGREGVDINTAEDLEWAEYLMGRKL